MILVPGRQKSATAETSPNQLKGKKCYIREDIETRDICQIVLNKPHEEATYPINY